MLYTGIIAALSSLDLGIKWLIDPGKTGEFPEAAAAYKRKNPAVPESQRRFSLRLSGAACRACADAARWR